MNKNFILMSLTIGVLCLLIGVLLGVGIAMIPEGKCIRNPLYYGISQFETEDLKVSCSCYFDKPNYAPFFFNKTGVFPYGGN